MRAAMPAMEPLEDAAPVTHVAVAANGAHMDTAAPATAPVTAPATAPAIAAKPGQAQSPAAATTETSPLAGLPLEHVKAMPPALVKILQEHPEALQKYKQSQLQGRPAPKPLHVPDGVDPNNVPADYRPPGWVAAKDEAMFLDFIRRSGSPEPQGIMRLEIMQNIMKERRGR